MQEGPRGVHFLVSEVPLYGFFYDLGVRALNNSGPRDMGVCGPPFIKVPEKRVCEPYIQQDQGTRSNRPVWP
jgi:hypothetical protein